MIQKPALQDDPLLSYFHLYSMGGTSASQVCRQAIPLSLGRGMVKCFAIEEGFCVGHYDIEFNQDFTYRFPVNSSDNGHTLYRLIFSLNNFSSGDHFYAPHYLTNNKISLYSINFERLAYLPKGKHYRSIEMVFSRNWLLKNYDGTSVKIFKLVQLLMAKKDPTYLSELLDKSTYDSAHKIASDLENEHTVFLHIKAQIFNLIDVFFQKTLERSQRNLKKNHALSYAVIKEIEKSLAQYYNDELPNIGILAREFNIGTSTLKRQFKVVFNKSIYTYYLEQKMALGMAMLEEKNASVSEIAYKLGYHKINSFSKIFKKHYGMLPSQFSTSLR